MIFRILVTVVALILARSAAADAYGMMVQYTVLADDVSPHPTVSSLSNKKIIAKEPKVFYELEKRKVTSLVKSRNLSLLGISTIESCKVIDDLVEELDGWNGACFEAYTDKSAAKYPVGLITRYDIDESSIEELFQYESQVERNNLSKNYTPENVLFSVELENDHGEIIKLIIGDIGAKRYIHYRPPTTLNDLVVHDKNLHSRIIKRAISDYQARGEYDHYMVMPFDRSYDPKLPAGLTDFGLIAAKRYQPNALKSRVKEKLEYTQLPLRYDRVFDTNDLYVSSKLAGKYSQFIQGKAHVTIRHATDPETWCNDAVEGCSN